MPTKAKKILLVEDNPGDVLLMEEAFKEHAGDEFKLVHETCLQNALKRLTEEKMDAILLDLFLPDIFGLETIVQAYQAHPQIPIIALTSFYDERTISHAIRMGAQDYLSKDDLKGETLVESLRRCTTHERVSSENN